MSRPVVVGLGIVVVALAVWGARRTLWMAAYPHLPPALQAVPYQVRARVVPERTPVGLPTVAVTGPGLQPTALPHPSSAAPSPTAPAPLPAATAAPDPTATAESPPRAEVTTGSHQYQTWNNCGPATVAMAVGSHGVNVSQADAARFLKPDPDDKNVSPHELADYARSVGLGATVRVNGSLALVKALIAAGFPVILEIWFIPDPGDEMGHYVVAKGYDDYDGVLVVDDSYKGPNRRLAYTDVDELWRVFHRTYILTFPVDETAQVEALLGSAADDAAMHAQALESTAAEVATRGDNFAWFNLGTSELALGRPESAVAAYDRARAAGLPWRMLWYQFGPFEAYAAVGRWSDVVALADANLRNAPNLEESQYWRGRALAATGDAAGARAAYRRAMELRPGYPEAAAALSALGQDG